MRMKEKEAAVSFLIDALVEHLIGHLTTLIDREKGGHDYLTTGTTFNCSVAYELVLNAIL